MNSVAAENIENNNTFIKNSIKDVEIQETNEIVLYESIGSHKEIIIDDNNYNQYFDPYSGKILDNAQINSGDTLKISSVTNKVFVIDRMLKITSAKPGDVISNGYIKLVNGSSGSTISGLTIINDKSCYYIEGIPSEELSGIGIFYSDNNTLFNNYVKLADNRGVFALPMGASSNNKIYNNTFISGLSTCVPMSECNNNIFYDNYFQSTLANLVYYNQWGHAGYGGSGKCYNNSFYNNTLNSLGRYSEWVKAFALRSDCDVIIVNNTISNVYDGISGLSSNSILGNNRYINNTNLAIDLSVDNITLANETFIDCGMAIAVRGSNINVINNTIINSSISIWVYGANCNIAYNTINMYNGYYAINVEDSNATIINNRIVVDNYGEGIRSLASNVTIKDNYISTYDDNALYLLASNMTIVNNKIYSNNCGILIEGGITINYYPKTVLGMHYAQSLEVGRIYNFIISDNLIVSTSYAVKLKGTVYNATVINNNITTQADDAFFIEVSDPFSNIFRNNLINGFFVNYTGIIINDDNFDVYFYENGTFKHENVKDLRIVITKLTNKILVISQKMHILRGEFVNLLDNVNIRLVKGSEGTIIEGLIFRNNNETPIVAENASNITIRNNDIIIQSDNENELYAIIISSSKNIEINGNGIYVNSKKSSINGFLINDSENLMISGNSLILEGNNIVNAFTINSLNGLNLTNNTIQLYGNGNFNNLIIENSCNLRILDNNFISRSTGNSSLLTIKNSNRTLFYNNDFNIISASVKNVNIVNTDNLSFIFNSIKLTSNVWKEEYLFNQDSKNLVIEDNIIYSNALKFINSLENVAFNSNKFVIYDDNIETFFDSNFVFDNDLITGNDTLLFDDIKLKHYNLIFNRAFNITRYSLNSEIDVTFILNEGSDNSNISGLNFKLSADSAFILNQVNNITIAGNNIVISSNETNTVSAIQIHGLTRNANIVNNDFLMTGKGIMVAIVINNYFNNYYGYSPENNVINGNVFNIVSDCEAIAIYNSMADSTTIINNEINVYSKKIAYGIYNDYLSDYKRFMSTKITVNTLISNNVISASANIVFGIYSRGCIKTIADSNIIKSQSNNSYGYFGNKTSGDILTYNNIELHGDGNSKSFIKNPAQTGIYLSDNCSEVLIKENNIVSNYNPGNDYAVYVEANTNSISLIDNYFVSNSGKRRGNDAIYAPTAYLENNALYDVYVSPNGSDLYGDGTKENPFATIAYAISQVINNGKVYVLGGNYIESNIKISKTVTLIGIGKPVIDLNGSSLFTIMVSGIFKVSNMEFINGNGATGSVFYNNGNLTLDNVTIKNSNGTQEGIIYNNNQLTIINSHFENNKAMFGSVIYNAKDLTIRNSTFMNNGGLVDAQGGAIYNTKKGIVKIYDSKFINNSLSYRNDQYGGSYPSDSNGIHYSSGGAIYSLGDLYIYSSIFDSNVAGYGGGAIVSKGQNTVIANSTFINQVSYWGGGGALYIMGSHVEISNSTFQNNKQMQNSGGAISLVECEGFIYNSTFNKNSASFSGGALSLWRSNIDLIFVNITDNRAENGGAISISGEKEGNHYKHNLNIYNSTITGNKGFNRAGAFFVTNNNLNVENSNIYDNFGGTLEVTGWGSSNAHPTGIVINLNHNYWGPDGPGNDVWSQASSFRDWVKNPFTWSTSIPEEPNNNQPNRPSRPNSQQSGHYNPGTGTSSNLNPSGSGNGFNTGIGTGIGSGFGSGSGSGNGNGNGVYTGFGSGSKPGGSGSSRGGDSGFTGISGAVAGTIGNIGADSNSGAGGSSGGASDSGGAVSKSYEINKNSIANYISENKTYISVILIIIVMILLIGGYAKNKKEGEE